MNPSSNQRQSGKIDIEALYNWLEQQPELEHLRTKADNTLCEYRPGASRPELGITVNEKRELGTKKKGFLKTLKEIVWVPGQNMRGKAFATPELDASLNSGTRSRGVVPAGVVEACRLTDRRRRAVGLM